MVVNVNVTPNQSERPWGCDPLRTRYSKSRKVLCCFFVVVVLVVAAALLSVVIVLSFKYSIRVFHGWVYEIQNYCSPLFLSFCVFLVISVQ